MFLPGWNRSLSQIVWVYVFPRTNIFKASALWADAFYKLKCLSVCPSVRLSVCSLLRYCLNVFLPPLPEVRCPIILEIQNPWEIMKRCGLGIKNTNKGCKIARTKKVFFFAVNLDLINH